MHIAAGIAAVLIGVIAVAARKGGRLHTSSGSWFAVAMIVLAITASVLEPFRKGEPGSPLVGPVVCYFVATSWATARRRDGSTGKFEIAACLAALMTAALVAWDGFTGAISPTPVGRAPVFVMAALLLLAGLLDLNAILRTKLSPVQRLSRHLWRMCFALFIATGSFFLGQQDILPAAVRGSPLLFVLGFAPFAVMAFWLVRLRFAKALTKVIRRLSASPSTAIETSPWLPPPHPACCPATPPKAKSRCCASISFTRCTWS
jgi:uncharacterized membrane protein